MNNKLAEAQKDFEDLFKELTQEIRPVENCINEVIRFKKEVERYLNSYVSFLDTWNTKNKCDLENMKNKYSDRKDYCKKMLEDIIQQQIKIEKEKEIEIEIEIETEKETEKEKKKNTVLFYKNDADNLRKEEEKYMKMMSELEYLINEKNNQLESLSEYQRNILSVESIKCIYNEIKSVKINRLSYCMASLYSINYSKDIDIIEEQINRFKELLDDVVKSFEKIEYENRNNSFYIKTEEHKQQITAVSNRIKKYDIVDFKSYNDKIDSLINNVKDKQQNYEKEKIALREKDLSYIKNSLRCYRKCFVGNNILKCTISVLILLVFGFIIHYIDFFRKLFLNNCNFDLCTVQIILSCIWLFVASVMIYMRFCNSKDIAAIKQHFENLYNIFCNKKIEDIVAANLDVEIKKEFNSLKTDLSLRIKWFCII